MNIQILEIETEDRETGITQLFVDTETLITVMGFGTGIYRWKVENAKIRSNPGYDPVATLKEVIGELGEDGMWEGTSTLGHALVWANPITFAHVVMDLIDNQ